MPLASGSANRVGPPAESSDNPTPENLAPSKKNVEPLAVGEVPTAGLQKTAAEALDPADAPHIWQQTLARLQGIAADYATQADHVAISAPNLLVVTFAKKYNSCKAFCEQPEQAQRIEKRSRR